MFNYASEKSAKHRFNMAERSDRIQDCAGKFAALKDVLGQGKTDAAFCDTALGIARTTYRSLIGGTHNGALEESTQRALRAKLDPVIGDFWLWPEWIETDAGLIISGDRRDTAANFKTRLQAAVQSKAKAVAKASAARVAKFSPPDAEQLFFKRIRQLSQQAEVQDIEPGFIVAAWHRLSFINDQQAQPGEQPLPATRAAFPNKDAGTLPGSTDSRFADVQLRCQPNDVQPWPVDLALTFGKSHPDGYTFTSGWVEFRFKGVATSAESAGERRRYPANKHEQALDVISGGSNETVKAWRLSLQPGGTDNRPNLQITHSKMPTSAAITVKSVITIKDVLSGEVLTAALVLPVKDQE